VGWQRFSRPIFSPAFFVQDIVEEIAWVIPLLSRFTSNIAI